MKKHPDLVERIKALRLAKSTSPAEFADRLGVSQSTIYAWEAGETIPSAEAFVQLGNAADYPENLYFWEKARVDWRQMRIATERFLKERSKDSALLVNEGRIILVPLLEPSGGEWEELDAFLGQPAEMITNQASTNFLFADGESVLAGLRPGDLFLVDTFVAESQERVSLEGEILLIQLPPLEERHENLFWPTRHCIGELRYALRPVDKDCSSYIDTAEVWPFGPYAAYPIVVGSWPMKEIPKSEKRAARILQRQMTPGYHLVGRVFGWYRPPEELK
jgi:transcriptional regulator with XRE-family HTH domain